MPTISIIMSVYNDDRFLRAAIDSILAQSFEDFEFIIINDGSTDSSPEIIASYDDGRINVMQNDTNIGLTKSLNKGIAQAKGVYIARMDADDIAVPHRLEAQLAYLEARPEVVVVGSAVETIDEDGHARVTKRMHTNPEEIAFTSIFDNPCIHPTVMVRKQAVDAVGGYDESLPYAQDYDLYIRLMEHGSIANIDEPLLKYRFHSTSITQDPERQPEQSKIAQATVFANINRLASVSREDYQTLVSALFKQTRSLNQLRRALSVYKRIYRAYLEKHTVSAHARSLITHYRRRKIVSMIQWYIKNAHPWVYACIKPFAKRIS